MRADKKSNAGAGATIGNIIGGGGGGIDNSPILIDGNNVVRASRDYGWDVLKALLYGLDKNNRKWFLYFDATIWYVEGLDDDGKRYIKSLVHKGCAEVCPARTEADAFILLHADRKGNHIISNDSYKKWVGKYPWIDARTKTGNLRVHKFMVLAGNLLLPDFDLCERIRNTAKIGELYKDVEHLGLDISEMAVASDTKKTSELHEAAKRGDAESQYRLGLYFFGNDNDWDFGRDLREAEEWLRQATAQGHDKARRSLGSVQCCLGILAQTQDRDPVKAVKWYRKAIDCGDVPAKYWLGRCYYDGEGVEKELSVAIKWYLEAAAQGYDSAQRDLGFCYSRGEGVTQDMNEAEKWWRKWIEQGDGCAKSTLESYRIAAEHGDAMAQYRMGMFYVGGEHVDRKSLYVADNPWLAAKWFRKAAEQGHAEAQYELSELYDGFFGGDGDAVESVKWLRKAAEQGHAEAQHKLDEYINRSGLTVSKENQ